ncbi:YfgM family protein [Piscirickettsia litoralis]|uniref:Ancillary SecYEG translocon subunit n=1 Tax=Piscirickettsia litoralis TaxID=1891921 RepID=A0ABX3A4M3_9GAMM|nr:tetratricopeptide repeat protein [Piscirickettsia litoralis]ODN43802.1 hypothetical protein BGC07_13975 [Piscirickettsia litoralis]
MDAQIDVQRSDHSKKITQRIIAFVVVIIIVALIAVAGWQYSVYRENNHRAAASAQYEHLLKQVAANQSAAIVTAATALRNEYPKTPYATLASLFMAKAYVQQNELPKARAALEWALKENKTTALTGLVSVRLARVLIAEKQYQQAIELLTKAPESKQYQGMYDYVLAEAYQAKGEISQARDYYQKAEKLLVSDATLQSIVQMKMNNLPVQTHAEVKK